MKIVLDLNKGKKLSFSLLSAFKKKFKETNPHGEGLIKMCILFLFVLILG